MDVTSSRQRLTDSFAPLFERLRGADGSRLALPIAPVAAALCAALVALFFLVMPTAVLEGMVVDSGIASLVTAAEPPLGLTARFAIAFIAALAVGTIVWFGTFLLIGARTVILNRGKREDGVPVLRRADAHPDAPARRPVFANRDLGTPFLDVKADPAPMPIADAMAFVPPVPEERDLPKDLDTPLANYLDPRAAPLPEPEPLPIVHAPEPVAPAPIMAEPPMPEPVVDAAPEPEPEPAPIPAPEPRFAPHERIETFELTPMVRNPVVEPSKLLAPATIHDLLERLERGVQRRADSKPATAEPAAVAPTPVETAEPTLEDTLSVLRQLAQRVG